VYNSVRTVIPDPKFRAPTNVTKGTAGDVGVEMGMPRLVLNASAERWWVCETVYTTADREDSYH
jgi:hypothetical protein